MPELDDSHEKERRLKTAVRQRIHALLAPGVGARDISRLPTAVDAVMHVCNEAGLRYFTRGYVSSHPGPDDQVTGLMLDNEYISYYHYGNGDRDFWTNQDPDRSGPYPGGEDGRLRHVRNWFDDALDNSWTLTHMIAQPYDAWTDTERAHVQVTIDAWWDARTREGQSPESARLLLSLIAHPSLLGALRFTDDGAAPTVSPCA